MQYGTTELATDFTEDLMRDWKVRLVKSLLFFIPRANPDVEEFYPLVRKWALELSDDGWPQREVALNADGVPIFRTPEGRNTGFWTDMAAKRFEGSELREISRGEFEQLWERANELAGNLAL